MTRRRCRLSVQLVWFYAALTLTSLAYWRAIHSSDDDSIAREKLDEQLSAALLPLYSPEASAVTATAATKEESPNHFNKHKRLANISDESFFNARFPDGSLGYRANPYALQTGVEAFLWKNRPSKQKYWDLLTSYEASERRGIYNASTMSLNVDSICSVPPGQGLEEEGGFRLLTEQILIAKQKNTSKNGTRQPRILCAMYTHAPMHDLARAAALTWGWRCDGFLAFTTSTVPSLGMVHLVHPGPEAYGNMWQKVRSIWFYIHQHYAGEFDFIHLCGDDTYVLVDNLRHFLSSLPENVTTTIHAGQWVRQKNKPYIGGGPGYTISWKTLQRFVLEASSCHADKAASYEDRLFSKCVQSLGIYPTDTRSLPTGQQQYHDVSPHTVYTSRSYTGSSFHARAIAYAESLPPYRVNLTHLEAAAPYSVAFHQLYNPLYMVRVHAILFSNGGDNGDGVTMCPADSVLGRGLEWYQGSSSIG